MPCSCSRSSTFSLFFLFLFLSRFLLCPRSRSAMLDVGLSPLLPNIGMAFPLEWALKKANVLKAMDGIALATAAAYLLYYASRSRRSAIDYDAVRYESLPLPPCLPKKGLAGHLYCFPKSFEYLVYGEWARQLGMCSCSC